MKKYSFKVLGLIFAIFVALYLIIALFYTQMSINYIEEALNDQLLYMNQSITGALDTELNQDLIYLQAFVQQVKTEGKDVLVETEARRSELVLQTAPLIGFGLVKEKCYEIDGVDYYYYNNEYLSSTFYDNEMNDYIEQLNIFHFENGYKTYPQDTKYIFLKADDYIFFYNVEEYLMELRAKSNYLPLHQFMILSKDGVIHFQPDFDISYYLLFDQFLRKSNGDVRVDQIISDFYDRNSNIYRVKYLDEPSFLAFSPLDSGLSDRGFIVAHIFASKNVVVLSSQLYKMLGYFFGAVVFVLLLLTGVLYFIILRKNSDIEISRLRFYYLKPIIVRINKKGKIKGINRSFKTLYPVIKTYDSIDDFVKKETDFNILECIYKEQSFTVIVPTTDGVEHFIRFIPVKSMFSYLLIGEDISEHEQMLETNSKLALYNQTTYYPNEFVLMGDMKKILEDKYAPLKNYALIFIDIVMFKNFNMLFGRKTGDQVLIEFTRIVQANIKELSAQLYNIEADQFAILYHDIQKEEEPYDFINKIIDVFKKPIQIGSNQLQFDLKFGMRIFSSKEIITSQKLYHEAGLALKKAKDFHTLQYALYDETLREYITKEQVMEQDLRAALVNNEFKLYLQPQFNNELGKIVAFEALIRWENPKYYLQSPSYFIELAEHNNMIIDIGRYVINETFKMAKELEPYNVRISMNVSPIQIIQAGFVNELIETFNRYQLKRGSIAIEITETFLMNNFEAVIDKFKILKDQGFSLHLDDFGTGYSSMLYLRELPIDTIKIDREFIKHINTDKYSRAIVSKIISLAKSLELDVIAEGVENDKQNQFLIKSGCNLIQGFLISKAVNFQKAVALIEEYNIQQTKQVDSAQPKEKKRGLIR